jgi:hypothetical protein
MFFDAMLQIALAIPVVIVGLLLLLGICVGALNFYDWVIQDRRVDYGDDLFIAKAKEMIDGKLKNDQVEPEEDTYVSFEELLEKPKRKNDEKEKWDSLPHYVVDMSLERSAEIYEQRRKDRKRR